MAVHSSYTQPVYQLQFVVIFIQQWLMALNYTLKKETWIIVVITPKSIPAI